MPGMSPPSIRQYLLFLLNGVVLGLLSWVVQLGVYWPINGSSDEHYAMSSFFAFVPVVFLNLSIQPLNIRNKRPLNSIPACTVVHDGYHQFSFPTVPLCH